MGKQAEGNGARRRQRRSFTPEFKAEVIALVRRGERSLPAICRELDLRETAVRRWVGQAAVDAGERDGLTTEEREELRRLRRENKVLREERDILKRAAAGPPPRDCDAQPAGGGWTRHAVVVSTFSQPDCIAR